MSPDVVTPIDEAGRPRAPRRSDGFLPIADYAALGDGHSLALVGLDGSIDWMCVPEIDAPSILAALLDPGRGGSFSLRPAVPFTTSRCYLERTNVLDTTFHTEEGRVRVTDALTIDSSQRAPWRELVRHVEGLAGRVPMTWSWEPRFDYGRRRASFTAADGAILARDGNLALGLQTWNAGEARVRPELTEGAFTLGEGEEALLALQAADDRPLPLPERASIERRLAETLAVWRSWIGRHTYDGLWRAEVERSLLTIRLLSDARRGAIAAAGTTSLPEVLGGERNYDYRFGWVRDLSFTLDALLAVGLEELAQESVTWLLSATRRTHPRADPVYALDGQVVRSQAELPLAGYRGTRPVHVGNQAGAQLQLGGFGDLLETLEIFVRHGHVLVPAEGERLADFADLLCHIWRSADAGLWELGDRAHYTTSKLGCWVAFDRVLALVRRGQVPPRHVSRWEQARDEVRRFIEEQLWSNVRRSYVMKAGSSGLDCGTLLMARRGFLDPRGERMNRTIDAIHSELGADGPLFFRYSGMEQKENAFLACTFWMVEALAAAGRRDEAVELMEAGVRLGNDVGLLSEEIEPGSHALWGNFPQALTHLALINAAVMITRGEERSRGGRG